MRQIIGRAIQAVALAGLIALGWLAWFAYTPLDLRASPLDFNIRAGSGLKAVSRQLEEAGVLAPAWRFTLLARLLGSASRIKAGSYEVESGVTPLRLLEKLTRGDVSQADIVFIEGWNFRQLRAALDAHPAVRHDTRGLSEQDILSRLGAAERVAEGLFFPDTYLFDKGGSDLDILRRAYASMQKILDQEWARRDPALPYATPYQALIVASLVEKETGAHADRAQVAAVFANRLRAGMLLQTDPSVIYGLGEAFDGNLRKADLVRDTAYNTYTRAGLPPTPIAMPGLASIQAAMRPPPSEYLYFVARGDGSSEFSRSLDEHNRAVNRYQRKRN